MRPTSEGMSWLKFYSTSERILATAIELQRGTSANALRSSVPWTNPADLNQTGVDSRQIEVDDKSRCITMHGGNK